MGEPLSAGFASLHRRLFTYRCFAASECNFSKCPHNISVVPNLCLARKRRFDTSSFFLLPSSFFTVLAEKQQRLLDDLLAIPDAQERLAVIVARARRAPALAPAERADANRVPGCVSAVWLVADIAPATRRLRLRADADSPLVKGLVALLCELYDDTDPAAAAAFQPELLEKLLLAQNLSPTRRNGLATLQARIKEKAERLKTT